MSKKQTRFILTIFTFLIVFRTLYGNLNAYYIQSVTDGKLSNCDQSLPEQKNFLYDENCFYNPSEYNECSYTCNQKYSIDGITSKKTGKVSCNNGIWSKPSCIKRTWCKLPDKNNKRGIIKNDECKKPYVKNGTKCNFKCLNGNISVKINNNIKCFEILTVICKSKKWHEIKSLKKIKKNQNIFCNGKKCNVPQNKNNLTKNGKKHQFQTYADVSSQINCPHLFNIISGQLLTNCFLISDGIFRCKIRCPGAFYNMNEKEIVVECINGNWHVPSNAKYNSNGKIECIIDRKTIRDCASY